MTANRAEAHRPGSRLEAKSFHRPEETRPFEPGWRWSEHAKPIAATDSCQWPIPVT